MVDTLHTSPSVMFFSAIFLWGVIVAPVFAHVAVDCPAGYFVNGSVSLFNCSAPLRECTRCPVNSFSAVTNAVACEECVSPYFAWQEGSTRCDSCNLGTYYVPSVDSLVESCADCPWFGVLCADGEVFPAEGYYLYTDRRGLVQAYECSRAACPYVHYGDAAVCGANRAEPYADNLLCGRCAQGFSPTYGVDGTYGGACQDCSGFAPAIPLGLLVGCLLMALLLCAAVRGAATPQLIILLVWGQLVADFGLPLNDDSRNFNLGLFQFWRNLYDMCVVINGSSADLIALDLWGFLLVIVQLCVVILVARYACACGRARPQSLWNAAAVTCWWVYLLVYGNVALAFSTVFHCIQVGRGVSLLTNAPAIRCDSDERHSLIAQACLVLFLFLLSPLYVLLFVRRLHARAQVLETGDDAMRVLRRAPWLSYYRPDCHWAWAVIPLRVFLLALTNFVVDRGRRTAYQTIILGFFLLIHVNMRPYVSSMANRLETAAHTSLVFTMAYVSAQDFPYDIYTQALASVIPILAFICLVFAAVVSMGCPCSARCCPSLVEHTTSTTAAAEQELAYTAADTRVPSGDVANTDVDTDDAAFDIASAAADRTSSEYQGHI